MVSFEKTVVFEIIYKLKFLPFIKKLLPNSLYSNHNLKTITNLLSISAEISTIFLGKLLYFAFIYWSIILLNMTPAYTFLHIILFLTIVGAILNTHMFNPTKDKYYAICLMRMDARKYVILNYIYYLLKTFARFLVLSLIFGLNSGMGIITCIAVPLFVILIKPCYSAWVLLRYKRTNKTNNEKKPSVILWIVVAILLVVAFLPPYLGYAISERLFVIFTVLMIIPAVFSIIYIFKLDKYRKIYKELLKPENIVINTSKEALTQAQMLTMQRKN